MAATVDDLLTVAEVCIYLRKSRSTVYRLTRAGTLPARKVGGTWRYSRRSLDEWLRFPRSRAAVTPLAPPVGSPDLN